MSQNLDELIQKCCRQNKKAQAQLYQLFSNKIFGICLQYSRNYEDAEDALQDGFLLILKKINTYKYKGSFEGWMKRVIINHLLKNIKKQPRIKKIEEIKENPLQQNELQNKENQKLDIDTLLKLVQQLPDQYRFVFNLYVLDNFSHQKIADLLQISVGTSKSNLHRARQILKEKIVQLKKQAS